MDYLLRVVVADMAHYTRFIMDTLLQAPERAGLQDQLRARPGQGDDGRAPVTTCVRLPIACAVLVHNESPGIPRALDLGKTLIFDACSPPRPSSKPHSASARS